MTKLRHTRKKTTNAPKNKKNFKLAATLYFLLCLIGIIIFSLFLIFLFVLDPAPQTEKITVPTNVSISIPQYSDSDNIIKPIQTTKLPFTAKMDYENKKTVSHVKSTTITKIATNEPPKEIKYINKTNKIENITTKTDAIQSKKINTSKKQLPLWQKNAAPTDPNIPKNAGIIAVIIDDMGIDKERSSKVIALDAPLTLSFMTYANDLIFQIQQAKKSGKELMLHIPMQPLNPDVDPGPDALTTSMTDKEIADVVKTSLSPEIINLGIAGVNNHMGSKFTSNKAKTAAFMHTFKDYGLYFIDSITHKDSYALELATKEHVAAAARHIFIDSTDDEQAMLHYLHKLEKIAQKQGYAIAIGHPYDNTIAVLTKWIPTLKAKGIYIVPASAVIKRRMEILSKT